jgi:hypothetical protein
MDFDKTHRDPRLIEPKKKPNTTTQRILKKICGFSFLLLFKQLPRFHYNKVK